MTSLDSFCQTNLASVVVWKSCKLYNKGILGVMISQGFGTYFRRLRS